MDKRIRRIQHPFSFVSNFFQTTLTGTAANQSDTFRQFHFADWSMGAYLVVIMVPEVNMKKREIKVNKNAVAEASVLNYSSMLQVILTEREKPEAWLSSWINIVTEIKENEPWYTPILPW